ncbi:hypothetical protein ABGB12_14355 [Actinocorallia sp. B10E7]|uniref:hypothetical protein n=1 Tax=Actinocorallia sp. B10E7 TaxID=3153558 RepID=UPI00325D4435
MNEARKWTRTSRDRPDALEDAGRLVRTTLQGLSAWKHSGTSCFGRGEISTLFEGAGEDCGSGMPRAVISHSVAVQKGTDNAFGGVFDGLQINNVLFGFERVGERRRTR